MRVTLPIVILLNVILLSVVLPNAALLRHSASVVLPIVILESE